MADLEKQIEKIVKELFALQAKVVKIEKDLEGHIDIYNQHIRNLHIGR